MLKTIIVEDEELAMKSIASLVANNKNLSLIDAFSRAEDAQQFLSKNEVDLILLDIELSTDQSGFDILDRMTYTPFIIVTTSKEDYAFEAFQYEVNDYLKKPIRRAKFNEAIEKVKGLQSGSELPQDDIYVKSEGRHTRISIGQINYVENVGDYVKIVMEDGKSHIIYTTMKKMETKLSSSLFFRVHRSFIVNLKKIVDIEQNSILIGDKLIPIARASKTEFLKRINVV